MRILHVFDHSLPLQSGYVSRSLGIIRAQRARGWETIHVTTPRYHASAVKYEIIDGFTFYRSPPVNSSMPVLRELLEMNATKRTLSAVLRAEKPDILHAHSPLLSALPALSVARKFGLPVVYEVRGLWEDAGVDLGHMRPGSLKYRASRALDSYAMSRADWVIALCDPLRAELVERGIPNARITVVPNAVDAAFLSSASVCDSSLREELGLGNEPILGFIGSFYSYEGLDLLLEAVPVLSARVPKFTILLVGGGPEEKRLRKIVQDMGIERFVRFVGRVHHEEVSRYYGLIDVLVFPRRKMRLTDLVTPLKPLEAMAHTKPIVASDVGGHRELIRDADTGYLFSAGSASALAACLEAVILNRVSAARIAANGRAFVERQRTWDAVVDRYAGVYEEINAAGKRHPD